MDGLEHISKILPKTAIYKELKNWIRENMTIVCDTREKENGHIICHIENLGGKCEFQTLKTADYAYKVFGNLRTDLIIERKNSLEELASNITANRQRFERELQRAKDNKSKLILLVEKDDYNKLFSGGYYSKVSSQSFLATLFTYQERYGIELAFTEYMHTGRFIYNKFYYHLRELIKQNSL